MERLITSNLKLGIIAGGQLAKMLIQEASKWDIATYVLDKEKECPAGSIASCLISGSQTDFDDVYNFGKLVDVLTYEMENINIEALKKLKSEGVVIKPDPDVLEMIQDKGLQKEFYRTNGIPTSPFVFVDGLEEIEEKINSGEIKFPFVQKIRKGGYDGQGVAVVNSSEELGKILPDASIIENKIEIDKEIAVIAARNQNGDISCFPVVEMVFNDKANLVDKLICPSTITAGQTEKAINIASQIIGLLNMEGLLAVEFFVDQDGEVIVNEMAPRPHNSGHHSIESIITSQFEQHLRSILNLPLGSTELKLPAVMLNIIGEEGYQGKVKYEGLTESMAIPGVKVHLYGKKETRPFRKMGHVTILSANMQDALKKADKVKELLKVKSWEKK
ncbi:5-(carboxyamino)imidazole ribonucleotide synthase [Alkalitalea saponilacus]|uniref:N5-carboxyaminoimidazole ribonucleotide synthase n=1 Tax=Alkalitalea saponilacus TaxID=889453 RepID=A0A1T5HT61_9BACT|nr:5-(carboxyamino)imidazole ribonucleotide synthase [Alkalitalea saponilacus]ASB49227.1 5-(carboxyamino)imidazole ribonucleotide synthase [Alkalitalea saponilacus]SKC23711.1 5-(carboxyamino)imidazole ribonucleotide synthase [Alkalitalea saponilacus]